MGPGRVTVLEGREAERAGWSGPPEPAGGWTPTAGPETRTGPDRGRAARRRAAGGKERELQGISVPRLTYHADRLHRRELCRHCPLIRDGRYVSNHTRPDTWAQGTVAKA